MSITKLQWHTEKRKVSELLPYDRNPRQISEKQMHDLQKSLKKFNLVELPAIDADGRVVAGHQRLKALQLLGRGNEKIEVRVPNRKLTEQEYKQYLISSNAISGDWDFEKLKNFDVELLLGAGLNENELANIWDQTLEIEDDEFDVEKELQKIKKSKTKLGDIFQLGQHKLICGDATDPAVVKKLLGKEQADMVYSDPVYNIGIDYSTGIGGKQNYGGSVNDKRTDDEYKEFLRSSMEQALVVSKEDVHVFYWCDQKYIWMVQELYRELNIANKRVCMWIKNGHNPTPGVAFNKCYEPCIYGTRGKPYLTKEIKNLNEIANKELGTGNRLIDDILDMLDIWLVKRLAGSDYQHATAKPPTLHEKAMRRCTKPGNIIIDSFAGSGSTLIAAEQLKRKAYLVELEPIFCDLIINRYEKLTNTKAKKIN